MTKPDAIHDLLRAGRSERRSQTEANRIARACRVLGLDRAETIRVFAILDYCTTDGTPHAGSGGVTILLPHQKGPTP